MVLRQLDWRVFTACLALLLLAPRAHAQVKPRFVIGVDTSGSMLWDLKGNATYGDGVGRKVNGETTQVKDGVYYGCGTTAGLDRDCDGFPNDSKIAIAKDAIRKMIYGFGDVEWALSKFHQTHQAASNCLTYDGSSSCTLQAYGNPQCNTGTTDNTGCVGSGDSANCDQAGDSAGCVKSSCRPGSGTNLNMKRATGSDFNGCINYKYDSATCPSSVPNPLPAADLLVGFTGFNAYANFDNRPAILKWVDNVESNFSADTTAGNFCLHDGAGDCELRPAGSTPIGSLIKTSGDYAASIRAGDSKSACRQYSTIILTDGAETCNTNPTGQAFTQAFPGKGTTCDANTTIPTTTPEIRTYVVGLSIGNQTEKDSLNLIAVCGGTTKAYFANSASELSAALADIVGRSIPVETCNGKDDDCDGLVDEGIPAGQPGTAAQPQALFCDGEAHRTTAQNNQVKLRSDYPNIAQSTPISARVVCGRVTDTCQNAGFDDDCDGKLDEDATNLTKCGTCPGAADVCDGMDNDCDGVFDEIQGSGKPFSNCPVSCTHDVPCGSSIGECKTGVYKCTSGVLNTSTCVGEVKPTTEICDEKDNNCNGVVDDPTTLAKPCTTPFGSTGICLPGTQLCAKPSLGEQKDGSGYHVDANGKPVCSGQVLPEDREKCDLLDHDCNGDPFTCTQSTCVIKPDPEHVGDPCGQGVGSCKGTLVCNTTTSPPTLTCNAVGGSDEICDGLDNDCDGKTDEGLGTGGPCGSSVGECKPGTYTCDVSGKQKCTGDVGPMAESCDGLDNDCDGKVDEELGLGDPCGSNVGACKQGHFTCTLGQKVCSGDVAPQIETCDCVDNDCDGKVDEDGSDTPLCPGGSQCTMCQCALPCQPTAEFAPPCPQGKAAVIENGACYCVGERCNDASCGKQTIALSDEVQCAPNNKQVSSCLCKNNECTFTCSGVKCSDGQVCDPTDGRCRQPTCLLPQFQCPAGQRCALLNAVFQCDDDACANVTCDANQACRDGTCVGSCAGKTCPSNQQCIDGDCVGDPCASAHCSGNEVCDPAQDGKCVAKGACVYTDCPDGQVCNAVSGACGEDPCLRTHCPSAEKCNSSNGQCEPRCASTEVLCGDTCVNPSENREHCGASADCQGDNAGENCGNDRVCSRGACSAGCADELLACDGVCIDPTRNAKHCGAYGDCTGQSAGQLCLSGTQCISGACRTPATPGGEKAPGGLLVATGGGGCACSVGPGAPAAPSGEPRGALLALGVWLVFSLRRRRSRTAASLTAAACALFLGSGCQVKPICLDCANDASTTARSDGGNNPVDNPDAHATRPDTGTGEPGADAGGDASPSNGDSGAVARPDGGCTDVELCNGLDDDCDGKVDEDADPAASNVDITSNPLHCGGCGKACMIEHAFNACVDSKCTIDRNTGDQGCDVGYHDRDGDPSNGCEYRCIKTSDSDAICDQLDNDCDGKIDENVDPSSDPLNCGKCGLRCTFAHAGSGASCSMKNCILDDTKCDDGFRNVDMRQATGCEYRCPVWPTKDEVCNAIDDDCDGKVDENIDPAVDPRLGVTCGSSTGECKQGSMGCVMGSPTCQTQTDPVLEQCDGKDNDCDNKTDEGFDTSTDVANCGMCGKACLLNANITNGHAVLECAGGQCRVDSCVGDFADRNGDYRDGCETPCTITGDEVCDGVDNDCNGVIDDNITAPSVVCAIRETGVCAANQTALDKLHMLGPNCTNGVLSCKPENAGIAGFEMDEHTCDTIDNDCDGKIDEMIPEVGQPCFKGMGVCKTTGVNVCSGATYSCNAATPAGGTAEACDGLDNDCNGTVDDFGVPSASSNITGFNVVNLGASHGNVLIMAYEASRPNATGSAEGTQTQKPCSVGGHLPWANVTWGEADAACCALNANGQCQANSKGWRLCDSADWVSACQGNTASCTWGYSNTAGAQCTHALDVTTYKNTCLGLEGAGNVTCSGNNSPCATVTGSSSYAQCRAALTGGDVFDLSGNLKEWTRTSQGTGIYELRGGSYNNLENGRTCAFDFTVGSTSFRFPTTGFRCCYYP